MSKEQNYQNFDVFDDFAKKIDWLGFGIHTSRQKQVGVQCVSEVFPFDEMG